MVCLMLTKVRKKLFCLVVLIKVSWTVTLKPIINSKTILFAYRFTLGWFITYRLHINLMWKLVRDGSVGITVHNFTEQKWLIIMGFSLRKNLIVGNNKKKKEEKFRANVHLLISRRCQFTDQWVGEQVRSKSAPENSQYDYNWFE